MPVSRRAALTAGLALLAAPAASQSRKAEAQRQPESDHGWFKLRSDEGKPFPNLRLPNELTGQVAHLPGLIRVGSETPDVTLVAFTDYNCPWCRKAAPILDGFVLKDSDLQLGLVNNAVLSPASKEAAKVELAVLKTYGRKQAYRLHSAVFGLTGLIDGRRALDAAAALDLDRALLAEAAASDAELSEALARQMRLADSLAFTATPSFLIGGAGVIGFPGPRAMAGMIASVRQCELIACD